MTNMPLHRFLALAPFCLFCVTFPNPAVGERLVHEGFDYAPGTMEGANGGVGWAGPYENFGGRRSAEIISPSGDENFGSGSYAAFARDSYHFRGIDTLGLPEEHINERGSLGVPGTSLWVSAFIQAESPVLPPSFGISFFEDGEEKLFLGRGTSEKGGWKIQTEHQDASSGEYTTPQWIVLRIDFNHDGSEGAELDRVLMFLNPDPSGAEPSAASAAGNIQRATGPISFNRVRFVGNGNGFRMNDFQIGTTFSSISPIAEPGTVISTK